MQPIGQVLIYPGLGGDMRKGSYVKHAEAPMLTVRDLVFYKDIRTGGADCPAMSRYAAGRHRFRRSAADRHRITAECDPLSSDGEAYRDRILAAGGKAAWFEERASCTAICAAATALAARARELHAHRRRG